MRFVSVPSPPDGRDRVKALLLAGGLGERLRPLTEQTPKCLVTIAKRPLLDYWFDRLAEASISNALINTHYLHEQVRQYLDGVNAGGRFNVLETYEPALLGSAGTIHANGDWMADADECVVVYTDNLSTVDVGEMLSFHRAHSDPITMMLFHAPRPQECGIAELDESGRIRSFVEKPTNPRSDLANAGLYIFDASVYREIAAMRVFDIGYDVLPQFVGRMQGWVWEGYHRDIGTLVAYEKAQEDAPRMFWSSVQERRNGSRPAVFCDRDGTLIEHVHHLTDPEKVQLLPGVAEGINSFRAAGFVCVVITNQSVVGRGVITESDLAEINRRMCDQLAASRAELDAIYYCPIVPVSRDTTLVEHRDRKPGPGMLLQAASDLDLDLRASWMIGDSVSDVLAGHAAGCRGTALLQTGQRQGFTGFSLEGCHTLPDFRSAVEIVLSGHTDSPAAP